VFSVLSRGRPVQIIPLELDPAVRAAWSYSVPRHRGSSIYAFINETHVLDYRLHARTTSMS